MSVVSILLLSAVYVAALFAIASYTEARHRKGLHTSSPLIYVLSLGVYSTAFTFYGSVGRASRSGPEFLATIVGPIAMFALFTPILRRVLATAKTHNVTSIADFIAVCHAKSRYVAGLVAIVAVAGMVPYVSVQLTAISASVDILTRLSPEAPASIGAARPIFEDPALYIALAMSAFAMVFGTRRLDATEQHRGLVAALAMESLIKLAAIIVLGVFVVWWLFDGPRDLLAQASNSSQGMNVLQFGKTFARADFWGIVAISFVGVLCLPRQFQVLVIENVDPTYLEPSRWGFPLFLLATNAFILPVALGGLVLFGGVNVNPDTLVLEIPVRAGSVAIALLVFVGGLAAGTGMLIAEVIALSTMVCNNLVMPFVVQGEGDANGSRDLGKVIKLVRRLGILGVLLFGFAYSRVTGNLHALVTTGYISFVAVAQFAPALLGGMYLRMRSKEGALAALAGGILTWGYTLLVPSLAQTGLISSDLVNNGPFGIELLKPTALLGWPMASPFVHALVWSLTVNICLYVIVGRLTQPNDQAAPRILDALTQHSWPGAVRPHAPPRLTTNEELMSVLARFVDRDRAASAYRDYGREHASVIPGAPVSPEFAIYCERLLAGSIGVSLARVVMASALHEADPDRGGVLDLLSAASQEMEINWALVHEGIENISQGMCVFDKNLTAVVWNRRLLEILELPGDLLSVGTPLEVFVRFMVERGDFGAGEPTLQIASVVLRATQSEPLKDIRHSPSGRCVEVLGRAMPSGGFVATYADITDRVKADAELQKYRENLEEAIRERTAELAVAKERADVANSAKSSFLAHMSHELRTPLNGILGYAQILASDRNVSPQQVKGLQVIRNCGEHLLALINDILDLSRVEAGYAQLEPSEIDLTNFLRIVEDAIKVKADEKALFFDLRAEAGLPQVIRVDERRLRQVLLNLLGNAVKFTNAGSVALRVTCPSRGDGAAQLLFEVVDSGPGIPEEQQQRIFEPFEQAGDASMKAAGTGLGLAISRQLVRLMGSDIRVTSVLGHGSTFGFEITVPILEAKLPAHAPPASGICGAVSYEGPRRRVLIVDDVAENRLLLVDLLHSFGFEVDEATNGQEGVDKAILTKPHLILMDNVMPILNGADATKRLRTTPGFEAVPIVAVSASASCSDQRASLAAGANCCVTKPIDVETLMSQIGEQLSLRWLAQIETQ